MVSGRFVDTCAFLTPRLARGCVSGWTPQLSTISAVMIRTCVARSRGTLVAVTLQIRVRNFAGPRGARPICFCCCFCFWPSPRNCWTLARASRLGTTRERLALMRVRRCEGFGLGLSLMAFAFYGGAGFVLGGREGARVCFSRAPDATAGASRAMRAPRWPGGGSWSEAHPTDVDLSVGAPGRSGSRRPEERSDGGLAPGGQRRRGTATPRQREEE